MKKIFTVFALLFSLAPAFSIPGFVPYVKDISGEYVYYQDKTFKRESYIGFLTYDDSTYEVRYFAPRDLKKSVPEKEIKIFFTLNPKAENLELTGERIASLIGPDDTEIVNYMHDMIYELSSRRKKAGKIEPNKNAIDGVDFLHTGIRINEDFPQFGGDVTVIYDFLVPIFNIKLIESNSVAPQFFVVTAGKISSTADTSFDSFKGFPEKYSDKKHTLKLNKKAENKTYSLDGGKSIVLDANWNQSMENLWLLGEAALISIGTVPENSEIRSESSPAISPFILRQLLLSNSISYLDWKNIRIENYAKYIRNEFSETSRCSVMALVYQPATLNLTRNIRIITKKENGYDFFTMTAFEEIYRKNERYFGNIVKAYSD